ncbi:MAG: TonB-dependent receptor [Paramuribaculum sp.]|nr:TonB-dependent receptor [Paramuribaculum sp.]
MSKAFNVKTWAMLMLAGLLSTGTAYADASAAEPSAVPQAQQSTGTCIGTVFDSEGEPLIGATVRVEGTAIGASVNIDGEFSLAGVKHGAKIVVNFIGYKPQTVVWNGEALNIILQEDSNVLDEVVVMGYGVTQKRAKVTNSIAKVSEETLTIGANADPAQALVGAISGVKVSVTSGDPGATPNITIRGGTTFNGADNNPVVVVDGQIRSSLSDINPNDIADMQILKDAGATALYGARASNGVIIVTTKQGQAGKAQVTFSGKIGISDYSNPGYKFLNARDYLYYMRKAYDETPWASKATLSASNQPLGIGRLELNSSTYWNVLTMTDENKYLLQQGWETMVDPVTGTDIIFRDTDPGSVNLSNDALIQEYNLSFSGGNDRGKYYASLGYYDADGAFQTTFYKRYNFALTGSYKLTSWLESNSVFNYTRANWNTLPAQVSSAANFFGRVISCPPTIRLIDEEGNNLYGQGTNINVHFQPEKFVRDYQSDKFQMTQAFTAKIIEGLTLKASMAWYYNEQLDETFNKDFQQNDAGSISTSHNTSNQFLRYFDQTYNLVANFNRTFKEKHTVGAMLGMEAYDSKYRGFSASGYGSPTEFQDLALTTVDSRQIDSWHQNQRILSYFGRVEYDYMDKYLIAATFREDGYSRLQNNRWGFFPGVSAGWVFTSEDFWKKNEKLQWLNYGKLRSSFGLNGNATGIGAYTLQGAYSSYRYINSYGYRIGTLPNPNLKWEKTRTFELGLNLGFLQNRFNLDLTYYDRLTSDKYASLQLPQTTGFSSVTTNNGKFRNRGVEIDFNGTLLNVSGFRWTLGANVTYNKNTVVSLPDNGLENGRYSLSGFPLAEVYTGNGDETKWIGGIQEGQEPGAIIGYQKAYIIKDMNEVPAGYIDIAAGTESNTRRYLYADDEGLARLNAMGIRSGLVKLEPGDVIWKDINGDNMIDTKDRVKLGHKTPHWTGGFNTSFSWKGLSLYARFDMGWGFSIYDGVIGWYLGCAQGAYNATEEVKQTWTPENPNAKYPRYTFASQNGTDNWIRCNSILTNTGAYLACRELQLSYQLPQNICKKFYSQGLTVSVTGQNLGYLKKCTNPLPDNPTTTNANTSGNGGTYNLPRTVLFGLNLTF